MHLTNYLHQPTQQSIVIYSAHNSQQQLLPSSGGHTPPTVTRKSSALLQSSVLHPKPLTYKPKPQLPPYQILLKLDQKAARKIKLEQRRRRMLEGEEDEEDNNGGPYGSIELEKIIRAKLYASNSRQLSQQEKDSLAVQEKQELEEEEEEDDEQLSDDQEDNQNNRKNSQKPLINGQTTNQQDINTNLQTEQKDNKNNEPIAGNGSTDKQLKNRLINTPNLTVSSDRIRAHKTMSYSRHVSLTQRYSQYSLTTPILYPCQKLYGQQKMKLQAKFMNRNSLNNQSAHNSKNRVTTRKEMTEFLLSVRSNRANCEMSGAKTQTYNSGSHTWRNSSGKRESDDKTSQYTPNLTYLRQQRLKVQPLFRNKANQEAFINSLKAYK